MTIGEYIFGFGAILAFIVYCVLPIIGKVCDWCVNAYEGDKTERKYFILIGLVVIVTQIVIVLVIFFGVNYILKVANV